MTTGLKIGIASIVGISTAGGVGFVAHQSLKTPEQKSQEPIIVKIPTIEEALKNGITLIQNDANDNIWKIAFNENKDSTELTGTQPKITDFNSLKTWCKEKYQDSSDIQDTLKKVKKLCELPPSTIAKKLEKDKKSLVSNWTTKFDAIKANSEQLGRLKKVNTSLESVDTGNDGKDKLQKWCEAEKIKELVPDSYEETYKKIVEFCT